MLRRSPTVCSPQGTKVTLFATADSITIAVLRITSPRGWDDDDGIEPKVAEAVHIADAFPHDECVAPDLGGDRVRYSAR